MEKFNFDYKQLKSEGTMYFTHGNLLIKLRNVSQDSFNVFMTITVDDKTVFCQAYRSKPSIIKRVDEISKKYS